MPPPVTLKIGGKVITVKVAVLPVVKVLLHPNEFTMEVIVITVTPVFESEADGMVNVPLVELIVSTAVLAVAELAPERSYVTVKVPLPRLVEFTVTVVAEPKHGDAAMRETALIFGIGFTVTDVFVKHPPESV